MSRKELLKKLLEFDGSIYFLNKGLGEYEWDSSEYLVILKKQHICNIFQRYLDDQLSNNEVEEWANAIECREDIELEKTSNDVLNKVLYELANPYLTEKLTKERARKLCVELSGHVSSG